MSAVERFLSVLRLLCLPVALIVLPGCATGGSAERVMEYRPTGEAGGAMRYLVSVPKGGEGGDQKFPLILFLHGSGERGTDIQRVKVHGPAKMVGTIAELDGFLVVSPQCPAGGRWDVKRLRRLLDEVIGRFSVDETRLYLTGLSLGGYGAWEMACQYPGLFAAIAPVCGGGKTEVASRLVNTPVWAFHGNLDSAVPVARSVEMIEAIRASGGREAKLTIYEGVGHDSWTRAYADPALYRWMLRHRVGK